MEIVKIKGERNRKSTEDFEGSETITCDTVIVDNFHYTSFKTHRMYNTKSEA